MGLRRFRRGLMQSSLFKPHYRSVFAAADTNTTGTVQAHATFERYYPEVGPLVTDGFWTAAGGVVALEQGVTIPDFIGDITLRGGVIGVTVSVTDTVTDLIGVKVFLCFGKMGHTDPLVITSMTGAKPWGWDPQVNADVSTIHGVKVLKTWNGLLDYNSKTLVCEHRVRPRKIDQEPYITSVGTKRPAEFIFIVHAVNLTSTTDVTVTNVRYHNLSFSADADTVVAPLAPAVNVINDVDRA